MTRDAADSIGVPQQQCWAQFEHVMHIWTDKGAVKYCPGKWGRNEN